MATVALGSKAVGSIVKLKVNGTLRDFIVVHQGLPSSMYDESCNGTWLLMKDCLEARVWNSSESNNYITSDVNKYLNGEVISKFGAEIQAKIKQAKLPCLKVYGDGISCKIFLLSGREVGLDTSVHQCIPDDGARLEYFFLGIGDNAKQRRITDSKWWLRSNYTQTFKTVWYIDDKGRNYADMCNTPYGIRPAMILPPTLLVSDDGSITTNTAPTTPASITVPESIQGGSTITVSWTASTDAQNNLEGYIVERSADGGGTWTQIYQGGGTSTTNTVPEGTETVMYRVKAYDSEGLYSAYRNSVQMSVINNTAPSAPASITVPNTVLGGAALTVTWGSSADVDGDLAGYALERQVDGGEWTEVYRGALLTYTDAITRGWTSVAYRVRAYDSYTAYSGYASSPTRAVNNNIAPVITCAQASGTDLGTKTEGFAVEYSASDADGDAVTVTEAMDGETVRTFAAEAEKSYTFSVTGETFMKLLNGAHELTISASDGQVTAVHKLTFTKEVTAASVTLAEPMEADAKITICVLSVAGDIPADADFTVKVTNNANDDAPVWEDCTTEVKNGGNHVFTNETAAEGFAFNFKVEVERGPSGQGGYINSVQGGFQ